MEKRPLGKTDMQVSVLGFGGAEIGFEGVPANEVAQLLGAALDAGLNVIDTAECYVNSEELIGEAASGRRNDFYLFSKCGHPGGMGTEDWSRDGLLSSIQRSLKRLRTDRLDLMQLHSCSFDELRKGEVIAALEEARKRGYARYIGYSGDGQAARYAVECGRFDVLQTSVSIADQEAIDLTLPLCRERGVGVIAKRPIANAVWRCPHQPTNAYHLPYWERLQKLQYEFARPDGPEAVSTALRFTLSAPGVDVAIVGTTKPGRWRENVAVLEAGPLRAAQFERIRARWREVAEKSWVGQT
ncbi:MAG TPA: aldo/keto reductase [Gemmataceae bacterium]|nr:aldo/keto reductase [Gemmataceae bacterium]